MDKSYLIKNNINIQLEEKFLKATEKAKKYKELYKQLSVPTVRNNKISEIDTYDSNDYKIL